MFSASTSSSCRRNRSLLTSRVVYQEKHKVLTIAETFTIFLLMLWLIWTRSEKGNKQIGFHLGVPALQKQRCCIVFCEETELVCKLWCCRNFYPWAFILCMFVLSTYWGLKPGFCGSVLTLCKMLHTYIFPSVCFPEFSLGDHLDYLAAEQTTAKQKCSGCLGNRSYFFTCFYLPYCPYLFIVF